MKLVVVESPTKSKTISKFLGKDYLVTSSYGHVRDLPRSKLGVEPEKDFEVQYLIPRKASPRVKELKKEASKASEIILATDEDREGEAIAWHLAQVLSETKNKKQKTKKKYAEQPITPAVNFKRIVFHEITEKAIKEALANPRAIDMNLVHAQQARRVLDRLVGYKLSPFLWKKIMGGLSAGRVQSVALRLIADREGEIRAFKPETYYSISATLHKSSNLKSEILNVVDAELYKINGEVIPKLGIKTEEGANKIVHDLRGGSMQISLLQEKEVFKNPLPPFITSTLQQAAANRLGFSSKKTMMLAQRLYENGFITYMRTDSVNISSEALAAAKEWLYQTFGEKYATEAGRVFKKKSRLAQEAHEAVRPTSPAFVPQILGGQASFESKDENKLYELIWRRFIASQMPRASFYAKHVEFNALGKSGDAYIFTANGNTLKFDGFLKIWPTQFVEKELPDLKEGESLSTADIKSERHETEPPPRFNEASLIKTLEKNGIGRPSTYAPTIATILGRNYVEKIAGRFHPTETGELVNNMLTA
ncbi:MAG: type I DNA topoisomerase, partial [Candidatus Liptonbacteria bacterium]|nr:type I DNA topoisomerase [Candidatus Liptonbacteria bacterium]